MERFRDFKIHYVCVLVVIWSLQFHAGLANDCGGDRVCPGGRCCSKWGWCGDTAEYCGSGCQSQCHDDDYYDFEGNEFVDEEGFYKINPNLNDPGCEELGFYTYEDFVLAAKKFPAFANTGNNETRKRELAAFFGFTAFITSGGRKGPYKDPYTWGYCDITDDHEKFDPSKYCDRRYAKQYPCDPNQEYYGRGPMKISWNYNYGKAAKDIGYDILSDPNILEENATLAFETAIWSWMEKGKNGQIPSAHDVITGNWKPSYFDQLKGRRSGFGAVTNVLAGKIACGKGPTCETKDRVGFYKRICSILGVDPGNNLDCDNQVPFDEDWFPITSVSQE